MCFCLHVVTHFLLKQGQTKDTIAISVFFYKLWLKNQKQYTPTGGLPVLAFCPNPFLHSSTPYFSSYGVVQKEKKKIFLFLPFSKLKHKYKVLPINVLTHY